jgi:hypothetical protein
VREARVQRSRIQARVLLWGVLLILTACLSDPGDTPGGETTLDGVPVHTLHTRTAPVARAAGPAVEIFGSEANPIEFVRALAWTQEGEILLADAGRALLLLSAEGDSLHAFGGSGEGPGEFRQILMADARDSGGVVFFDPVLNRVTEFAPSRQVDRLWSPEPPLASGSIFAPLALDSHGGLLGVALPMGPAESDASLRESPHADESRIYRHAPVTRATDSGVDTVTEAAVVRCVEAAPPECTPDGDMATMASGEHGTVVAPRDRAEARVFGPDLEPLHTVRSDDLEAEPFSKLVWDDRGRLWLGHWQSTEWWVVGDAEATRLELPEGFEMWDVAGDRALGVMRGALGVQRVAVLDLPPTRASP